jgi:hypothetical protein
VETDAEKVNCIPLPNPVEDEVKLVPGFRAKSRIVGLLPWNLETREGERPQDALFYQADEGAPG